MNDVEVAGGRHSLIAVLGAVTIVSYGSWYYAFGVLLDPIRADTAWSEASLTTSFSVASVAMGATSILGGRLLDRTGPSVVLLIGAVVGSSALLVVSWASSLVVFAGASAMAMGALGGLAFYHVTMAVVARAEPTSASRAITELTIWGAFSSAIYLPVTALLVDAYGWRWCVRIFAGVVLLVLGIAAIVTARTPLPSPATTESHITRPTATQVIAHVVASSQRRSFTAAVACGGIALSTILVYQIPAMTAAGLPLTTAATAVSVRGFAQLFGRLPLTAIVSRVGPDTALVLTFATLTAGSALLFVAGSIITALAFALLAGIAIGAFSPLQGISAERLFDQGSLGTTMGIYQTVLVVVGAAGPALAGILTTLTGNRNSASAVAVAASIAATASALRLRYHRNAAERRPIHSAQ